MAQTIFYADCHITVYSMLYIFLCRFYEIATFYDLISFLSSSTPLSPLSFSLTYSLSIALLCVRSIYIEYKMHTIKAKVFLSFHIILGVFIFISAIALNVIVVATFILFDIKFLLK